MPATVSICIPTYNQTEFLRKNLESIVTQTYTNYEIIISDDSTTDVVETYIRSFFSDNPCQWTYQRNRPGLGSPANWNKAISLAGGTYIKIMHHDDWFNSSTSLGEFVSALDTHPEVDFAFSATRILDVGKQLYSEIRPTSDFLAGLQKDPLILFNNNRVGAPSATIYRSRANLLFDTNMSYLVDLDFYIRILHQGGGFVFIDQPLIVNTSNHPGQVTASFLHNKKQIGEYCYLYNKLQAGKFPSKHYRVFFESLFFWLNLNSFHEIKQMGFPKPKPLWIFRYLLLKAKLRRTWLALS